MPDQDDNDLPQLLGPYENWVLGPVGRPHAGMEVDTEKPFQFTGLVEIGPVPGTPAGVREVQPEAGLYGDMPDGLAFPLLWPDAQKTTGPSGAHILPGILTFPGDPARGPALAAVTRLLVGSLKGSTFHKKRAGARAEFGYRLNAPLQPSSFDPEVAARGPSKTVSPKGDPALRARLAEASAGGSGAARHPLVIVAVIDDGLPFAHPCLRDRNGKPRMEFCWLQSADAVADGTGTVLFGRELTRSRIEALVARHGSDEDGLYIEAGSMKPDSSSYQPMEQLWSHGAHVLDIAAGHDHADVPSKRPVHDPEGDVDRIRLIGVELPAPLVIDTVGFGKDAVILSAMHYIFARADEVAAMYGLQRKDVPLVINFSFGFTGGPHDGTDRLEEAIAHLVQTRQASGGETRLVMPAGNDFLNGLHGEITSGNRDAEKSGTVLWRVQPNDRTPNYLEIWYPPEARAIEPARPVIISPSGKAVTLVRQALPRSSGGPRQTIWNIASTGAPFGQVSIDLFRGIRWRMIVILAPTEPWDAGNSACEAGLWQIRVDASPIAGARPGRVIACRIQRDNGLQHPAQGGRQSYFDHPSDTEFDDDGNWRQDDADAVFTKRFGSLNGLATHGNVIVVGGATADTGRPARYSSAGAAKGAQVTCAAPSDSSVLQPGLRAAGTRAGSTSRMIGTSAAAPQVARGIALAFLDPAITTALDDGTRIKGLVRSLPGADDGALRDTRRRQSAHSSRRLGQGVMSY